MAKVKVNIRGGAVVLLILAVLAGFLWIKFDSIRDADKYRVEQLLDYDATIFAYPEDGIGANVEAQDALRLCPRILSILRWGSEDEWTEELLSPVEMLMSQYYEYGYLPREPYEGVGDYVTAMDAPLLAVTAELAYERGLGEQYHQYMEDLIPYLVKDTSENGFVLRYSDDKWWPLEYAWQTISEEDAWFVLNGSLYGMVYIEMLKNLTGDPRLVELSEKTLNAYKEKANEFLYPDGSWCYYSLNYLDGKKIINPTRKLAVEINAYASLYALTGETFYQEQLKIRNDLIAAALPVYIVTDETTDTDTVMLLRASAPHPYLIETYENILELLDEQGNIIATLEEGRNGVKGIYIMETVPKGAVSYRLWRYHKLYQGKPAKMRLWAEGSVKHLNKDDINTTPADGAWSVALDAESLNGKILNLNPNASENLYGHANFTLSETAEYTPETYYAIEITNPTEYTLNMRLCVYDENHTTMGRTLLPLTPGKNVLFYSPLGFKEHDWPLTKASLFNLILVTNELPEPIELELGDVYVFQKAADAVSYLSRFEFTDFWTVASENA